MLAGKRRINRQARRVRAQSPGLFNSGYFVLSAARRGAAAGARSGRQHDRPAARRPGGLILVISKFDLQLARLDRAQPAPRRQRRRRSADRADLETGVAGGAAQLNDYGHVTRERIPLVIAAITLVTFLILVLVLRAIPLAAIAVGLNLLTVGVAFGILTLLFNVPEGSRSAATPTSTRSAR